MGPLRHSQNFQERIVRIGNATFMDQVAKKQDIMQRAVLEDSSLC